MMINMACLATPSTKLKNGETAFFLAAKVPPIWTQPYIASFLTCIFLNTNQCFCRLPFNPLLNVSLASSFNSIPTSSTNIVGGVGSTLHPPYSSSSSFTLFPRSATLHTLTLLSRLPL